MAANWARLGVLTMASSCSLAGLLAGPYFPLVGPKVCPGCVLQLPGEGSTWMSVSLGKQSGGLCVARDP